MRIMVDLDPRDVWRIEEKAEQFGIGPGDVLRAELAHKRRTAELRDRVLALWEQGMCDADVAAELGYTNEWVKTIRRGMGLPANRRYPKRERKAA